MLLIDRNNDPVKTVYYIAALAHSSAVPYEFFLMAIDFLFLVAGVEATEEGGLRVHRVG